MGSVNLPPIRRNPEMIVRDLMNFSPHGTLAQSFIIEAIRYYSELVSNSDASDDPAAPINPRHWHEVAVDTLKRLQDNFE
jgi:hypothetical protein